MTSHEFGPDYTVARLCPTATKGKKLAVDHLEDDADRHTTDWNGGSDPGAAD